jgi:hypothetical protein
MFLSYSLFLSFSHAQQEVEDYYTYQEAFKTKIKKFNYDRSTAATLLQHVATATLQ